MSWYELLFWTGVVVLAFYALASVIQLMQL